MSKPTASGRFFVGFLTVLVVGYCVLIPGRYARADDKNQTDAMTQARGIHQGQIVLSQGRNEHFSDDIVELIDENYFTTAYVLSPLSDKQIPGDYHVWSQSQQDDWVRKNASYILIPGLTDDTNSKTAAVFLRPDDSNPTGMAVTFNDGHTEWLNQKDARQLIEKQTGMTLEQLIARQAGYRPPALWLSRKEGFDLAEKITLNPDGSGKAVIDLKIVIEQALLQPGALPEVKVDALAKAAVREIMTQSAAVEVWKDLSCQAVADGRIRLRGTAYFKNIDRFSVGGSLKNDLSVAWAKDPAGGMKLEITLLPAAAWPETVRPLTQQQIEQLVADTRGRWDKIKRSKDAVMEATRLDVTVALPGRPERVTVLRSEADGVRLTLDGRKIPAAVDKWLDDGSNLKGALKASRNWATPDFLLIPGEDSFYQSLFGQKGAIAAHVSGDLKTQFDYAAEVSAAKGAQADMLQKLGLTPEKKPAGGRSGGAVP